MERKIKGLKLTWCPESNKVANLICEDILAGKAPLQAVVKALKYIYDKSPTCIEDVGRAMLKHKSSDLCAKIFYEEEPPNNELEAALFFIIPYTYYRRIRDINKMKKLVYKYEKMAKENTILWTIIMHAKAMLIEKSEEFSLELRIIDALELELKIIEKYPNYVGAAHKFADLVAQLLEEGYKPGNCRSPANKCIPQEYVNRAELILRNLARDYKYARAYYTLARIAASMGRYQEAESLVTTAISLEDPDVKDYMLRLSEYYNLLFLIRNIARMDLKFKESEKAITERLENIVNNVIAEVRRTEERLLAWTSLYVAVVAIIFTYLYAVANPQINFIQTMLLVILITALIMVTILTVYILFIRKGFTK